MWMVNQYNRHERFSDEALSAVSDISVEEMKDHITIREAGWSPDHAELKSLSERTDPIRWNLYYSLDDLDNSILYQKIDSCLHRGFPIIVGVDVAQLRNRGTAGGHAIVVTGLTSNRVVINDPWGEMGEVLSWDTLANAWDPAHLTITTHLAWDPEVNDATVRETNER